MGMEAVPQLSLQQSMSHGAAAGLPDAELVNLLRTEVSDESAAQQQKKPTPLAAKRQQQCGAKRGATAPCAGAPKSPAPNSPAGKAANPEAVASALQGKAPVLARSNVISPAAWDGGSRQLPFHELFEWHMKVSYSSSQILPCTLLVLWTHDDDFANASACTIASTYSRGTGHCPKVLFLENLGYSNISERARTTCDHCATAETRGT